MSAELKETRELCKALTGFLRNYLHATRGTRDATTAEKAAGRVTDALTDCLSRAVIELAHRDLPETFECKSCGPHNLARDLNALRASSSDAPGYIILMRTFAYRHNHAKEAMRQLELRGYQSTAANVELVPA